MPYDIAAAALPEEERRPTANQMIVDVLSLVPLSQIERHLIAQGWTVNERASDKMTRIYTLADPDEPDQPYVLPLPANPQVRTYLAMLQLALERLAAVENTTFLTIVCRVLQVEQIVLKPEQS